MLYLRKPRLDDLEMIQELYVRSVTLHWPWVYPPQNYTSYLMESDRYFLCLEVGGDIVGTFNISCVVRGYFQSAYLGYAAFSPYQGKGYMRIGMDLLIQEAFGPLNLHRLEANIQPGNIASIRLVAGAGFVKEGYSKGYLNIGGLGWKDHERWALLNENWMEPAS